MAHPVHPAVKFRGNKPYTHTHTHTHSHILNSNQLFLAFIAITK